MIPTLPTLKVNFQNHITILLGNVDPVRDIGIITNELILKDIAFMETKVDQLGKALKTSKDKKHEFEFAARVLEYLKNQKEIRFGDWKTQEVWPNLYLFNAAIV